MLELGGWSPEEIVGPNLHDVLHPKREDGSVSPREECALHNGILRGEPAQAVANLFRKKDGRWIPIEWYGCPLREPVGRTWYMATISNFSDIETAREALRRKEEQYRRILESMPDVAWTADVNGRTRYISPKVEALIGFTNKEFYAGGTHLWLNQIHPEDFGRVAKKYMALFEEQVAFDEEYRIRRKDGTWMGARSCHAHI